MNIKPKKPNNRANSLFYKDYLTKYQARFYVNGLVSSINPRNVYTALKFPEIAETFSIARPLY
jgi:hypothetical protein